MVRLIVRSSRRTAVSLGPISMLLLVALVGPVFLVIGMVMVIWWTVFTVARLWMR